MKRIWLATLGLAAVASAPLTGCSTTPTTTTTSTAGGAGTTTTAKAGAPTTAGSGASTTAPDTSAAALAMAKSLAGSYSGTWKNLTFNSTGGLTGTVKVDEATKTLTFNYELTGNVFGAPAPGPLEAKLDITKLTTGATYTDKLFGPMTVTITPDLSITLDAPQVVSARVSTFKLQGKIDPSGKVDATYQVGFKDGSPGANGTLSVTRG